MAKINKELAQVIDLGIIHEGDKIILPSKPKPMTYRKGAECLLEKAQQEEQRVFAHELIEGNPFDALAAFHAVLKQEFGWSTTKGKETFFGPKPPRMVDIKTGPYPQDVIQVPVGVISAPGLEFSFEVMFDEEGLHLIAELPQYQAIIVKELGAKVRVYLQSNSIYKGKAFKMPRNWSEQPTFVTFDHMKEEELVLSKPLADLVLVNLLTPIQKTALVKADGIPVKRTVVLSGKYGTGKSMTISVVSKVAIANKWTVIYLEDTNRLADALENAKRWQPCLIAAEDLDRVTDKRDDKANHIFNTLSGVLSSGHDIMVVLTTNHPERIDRAMLRPGRIDALIEVYPPDAEAVERLVRLYGRGLVDANGGLARVGEVLAEQIPATIREVVERAKLARIANDSKSIDEAALMAAINSMGPQIELLNSKKQEAMPTIDSALRELVRNVALQSSLEAHARDYDIRGHEEHAEKVRATIN